MLDKIKDILSTINNLKAQLAEKTEQLEKNEIRKRCIKERS